MKVEDELIDFVIEVLIQSGIESKISGRIYPSGERPLNSEKEDIVVSVLSTHNDHYQESYLNVNLYVKDQDYINSTIRNRQRSKELSKLIVDHLHNYGSGGFLIKVESCKAFKIQGSPEPEHATNIKILLTNMNL